MSLYEPETCQSYIPYVGVLGSDVRVAGIVRNTAEKICGMNNIVARISAYS
jgi:hypothetical protein